MRRLRATTILLVRRKGVVCMVSDGQVTNAATNTVLKTGASKVKRAGKGTVLVVTYFFARRPGLEKAI